MEIIGIGVLLLSTSGTYLFQERDYNTTKNPGQIALFGGGLEEGEDVTKCAIRELEEELGLRLNAQELRDSNCFESHNQPGKCIQIFIASNINKASLELQEGNSIVELSLEEALIHSTVTEFTKEVLRTL
jgi:8-oxo-dGTP pyrophosphatase MutT (NUDIX family)